MKKLTAIWILSVLLTATLMLEGAGAGSLTTYCEGCPKPRKVLELDRSSTASDPESKDLFGLAPIMANSTPGEAYVVYPGSPKYDHSFDSKVESGARITLYPTANPAVGLAKGYFQFALRGLDPNKPDQKQNVTVLDLSFNPGAEVLFGNSEYRFPLIPGYTIRGYGVRFTGRSEKNPLGVVPLRDTVIEKVD
jgi:hypothetical protein